MKAQALLALAIPAVLGTPAPLPAVTGSIIAEHASDDTSCDPNTEFGRTQGSQFYFCHNIAVWSEDYHCVSYKTADFCSGKVYCSDIEKCPGDDICLNGLCLTKVNRKQCQRNCASKRRVSAANSSGTGVILRASAKARLSSCFDSALETMDRLLRWRKKPGRRGPLGTSRNSTPPGPQSRANIDPGPSESPLIPSFPDGVKVLHDCLDATIDICFVHGLTGDRESTWTTDGQSAPWRKTLLPPKLNKVRILTYGYDVYIVRKSVASSNRLIDHATNLLNDLTTDKACCNASSRPYYIRCP
ncbi:hypothetical protein B0T21DRAFT_451406 [Apiosordaria backusii]|uniref:Uncharacterized protein n=1 Tax=Apiosordaria backusii TaxID=314023 RepID=A0AA40EHY6_9PEZI|nr:hypothetical protein B0T21DRAFT_451406 [Apiosordaria backusii]